MCTVYYAHFGCTLEDRKVLAAVIFDEFLIGKPYILLKNGPICYISFKTSSFETYVQKSRYCGILCCLKNHIL